MARYTGAILLAALILWTGEARGECAWVVWEEKEEMQIAHDVKTVRNWTIHSARQTPAECEETLNRVWQKERDNWERNYGKFPTVSGVSSAPGSINVMIKWPGDKFTSYSSKFRCLPDTIDPRAPKGAR